MEIQERLYINCAKVLPKQYKEKFTKLLIYAGMKRSADVWLGKFVFIGALLFTIVFMLPKSFIGEFQLKYTLFAIAIFAFVQLMSYLVVYFKAEERSSKVEDALPDAFQIIAANLRSGMTPFEALKLTARKEFGPLQEEIQYATSRAMGTESFSDTLLRTSERIRSDMLDRALKLFTTAMRSGGHLASLLEELARDIGETKALRNEIRTSTKTYTAFIMFTIIIGTPLLLAISINFVKMVSDMQEQTSSATAGFGMGFLAGDVAITPEFLTSMSMFMLFLTAVLASILMGVINEGKPKYGLKYAPTVIIGCFIVFFIANHFVGTYIVGIT